ncbi:polysaccharide ABC transporter ATP-binding protein [Marinicella sp. S1101]|uniref:ABC transporter ATP-binding protein n=1 Tax=Marinicella marina TaxID=2996016 RepID=UPI002260ECB8|nr:polysaccharide ABC transporter ATP-binding protein [Marinicella marina]MCX7552646.1 polysaccharide ABC transporter ATP-binding protein [Marinicella marina]MDJ1139522.1 polysaccharide ABC transporter ATP-binding protein [Marinicella marina]
MSLIKIENINKFYPHVATNQQRVRGMLKILLNKNDDSGKHILKDISFSVNKGESLAIIGKNGAGKSTLLKIISSVIQPTSGRFEINGTVGALLELGSGFDPEYTGIENLRMSAALYGLQGDDADERINNMIKFANIGEYINEPVKNYSSGMVVRLGFSVITQTKPDLLITDEVLAVGDHSFQLKCLTWIDQYLKNGGTLLLVSHSVYHVQKLCAKALWLEQGVMKGYGDVFEVTQAYQASITDHNSMPSGDQVNRATYHIHDFIIRHQGQVSYEFPFNSDIDIEVQVYTPDDKIPGICFGIATHDDQPVYGTYSELFKTKPTIDENGMITYRLKLPGLKLMPGMYEFKFHTMTPDNIQMIDTFKKLVKVKGQSREHGVYQITTDWK